MFQKGDRVFCVGIKGTGLSALAELLQAEGVEVSGSDTKDVFYTDAVLKALGIPYYEDFDAARIDDSLDAVIYSAAYSADNNAQIAEAARRGLPLFSYPEALGLWSRNFESAGISGVHGKTTTTSLAGLIVKAAGVPAQVLAGSAVSSFGGRSTLINGSKFFIAETCEYRKHFLHFAPRHIVITAVESDHEDYFPTYESMRDAFVEYALKLPSGGNLVFCADDKGAREVVGIVREKRGDINFIDYGFKAAGRYKVANYRVGSGEAFFDVAGSAFCLRVPGAHNALNFAAALAQLETMTLSHFDGAQLSSIKAHLTDYKGSKRRAEVLGERAGVLYMDDYAHHPTAIAATIAGLRDFYKGRRLVVSFMSHTYTRTAALLDDFALSLSKADVVILHKIYASAREVYTGGVNGRTLYEGVKALNPAAYYYDEPLDAAPFLKETLRAGDLFITMGAGDNWVLGKALFEGA